MKKISKGAQSVKIPGKKKDTYKVKTKKYGKKKS